MNRDTTAHAEKRTLENCYLQSRDSSADMVSAQKTVHRRQDGFKAHVAVEPDTGLITACELTKASGVEASDGATGIRLLNADKSWPDLWLVSFP